MVFVFFSVLINSVVVCCNIVTVNHKYIGMGYGMVGLMWGICGGMMSLVIRLCLCSGVNGISGDNVSWYNGVISWHGLWMVFMFVMGILLGGVGNYWVMLWIGSSDVVYPRLNNISLLLWFVSGTMFIEVMCGEYGGGAGWTMYPPLVVSVGSMCGMGVTYLLLGLLVNGTASTLSVGNWISTIFNLRCSGLSVYSSGVGVWCIYVVSVLLLGVLGILAAALGMVLGDMYGCGMWFEYMGNGMNGCSGGGDSVMYQHLFWVFGHPEVYVMLLPGMGIISTWMMANVCLYGNGTLLVSVLCIGILGCVVWCHHMYRVGLDVEVMGYFSVVTLCIGVPTGCKLFNWCCSGVVLTASSIKWCVSNSGVSWSFATGSVAVVFVLMIVVGGSTGIMLGVGGIDVELHESYFVIAHFHVVV